MTSSVTFVTSCWEANWEVVIKTDHLSRMIGRNRFPFTGKLLFINNVEQPLEVARHAERLVSRGVLTGFYLVSDHAEKAMHVLGVDPGSTGIGYRYLITDLVAAWLCQSKYMVRYTADAMLMVHHDWITPCLRALENHPRAFSANPLWTRDLEEARRESFLETVDMFLGYRFSDQCYLLRTEALRGPIYNERNQESEMSPAHAGNSFERRVDAYMRNHARYKITYKLAHYLHENFPPTFPEQVRQLRYRWLLHHVGRPLRHQMLKSKHGRGLLRLLGLR